MILPVSLEAAPHKSPVELIKRRKALWKSLGRPKASIISVNFAFYRVF